MDGSDLSIGRHDHDHRLIDELMICFFVLMVIHDGVRLGRKTYLVDLGGAEKRTDYVAVSNSLIGLVLLGAGALSGVVQSFGNAAAVLMFSVLDKW